MSTPERLPIPELIERFERNSARAAFMFFAVCGLALGVLLLLLRAFPAMDGDALAQRQVTQGIFVTLLSLSAILFIRQGRHQSIAGLVIAIIFAIISFSIFGMEMGVRSASVPFLAFALLLSLMVFGLRVGLVVIGFATALLAAGVLAELGGFISGPVGERFVTAEVHLLCLSILYLFALGFSIHMDRQSRLLEKVLEQRREALQQALEEIQHAQGSKDRFLKSLSSEVEAPLSEMVQAIEAMQADDRRAPVDAGGISSMSARVMQFLENALGSARRLSAGGLELELCSPVQMLQIRCDHWTRIAQAKGLKLVQDIDTAFAPVCVGPTQLYLDAINAILDNAVRYTVQGSVLVRLQAIEGSGETVVWRLVVSDTGSGIAETVMRRIRPFLRRESSSNTQDDSAAGFGGLLAVKRWAEATDGDADVLSRIGQGCIVTVTFELRRANGP